MTEATLDIKYWGNNLGVRIPSSVAKKANLHADQRVRISVEDGKVIISPVNEPGMTLLQRLNQYQPEKHNGEVMKTNPLGVEAW